MAQALYSPHSERALLGALLRSDEAWWRIQGRVNRGDFGAEAHAALFDTIASLREADKPADIVTVEEAGGGELAWLGQIAEESIAAANAGAYADIVRAQAQRRKAVGILDDARARIEDGEEVSDVMASAQTGMEQVQSSGESYRDMRGVLTETVDAIDDAMMRRQSGGLNGFATGVPSLDRFLGGISGARLYLIAARPSLGKTALAHQIALSAARHGHAVGRCDLEMSYGEIGQRTAAHEYGINFTKLVHGYEDAAHELNQGMSARPITNLPIYMDADTYHIGGIVGRLSEWKHKHDIQLGIVDHLQLVHAEGLNRNEQLGNVTAALKRTAKRLQIPIILVCQFNRDNVRQGRRPRLEDLRDSGNIEQDIDVALAINAELENGGDHGRDVELGLIKNRQGKTGWLSDNLIFDGATQTFREVAPEYAYGGSRGAERAAGEA